jgi:hypothetical protein
MSESLSAARFSTGIGGSTGRPLPWCRPVRIVLMNISSLQSPRPVPLSGVRFAVKLTPHGPAKAVLVPAPIQTHGLAPSEGGAGITRSPGGRSAHAMSAGPAGSAYGGAVVAPPARTSGGAALGFTSGPAGLRRETAMEMAIAARRCRASMWFVSFEFIH